MKAPLALVVAATLAAAPACSPLEPSSEVTVGVSSVTNGHLWILNRSGNPSLSDFYTCLLSETNWNQLAAAYSNPLVVTLGKEAWVSGSTCNPGGPDDQGAFQCAVNAGGFDVKPYDLVLIIRDDNAAGGQNDSGGGISVRNPISGAWVPIDSAEVGTGTRFGTWDYYYVYSSHEVFEAQTDGISADCCDGETAYGGSFPWCSACGGPTGACGAHQGDLGIARITCPSGHTYPYQTVSPPGGHYYGSPEFNGTCQTVHVTNSGGWSCGNSQYNGQQYWTCANGALNKCDSSGHAVEVSCGSDGCKSNPSGTDDQCNWNCANSALNGNQYWTCTNGNLFECDSAGHPKLTFCGGLGCKTNASGTNDQCYQPSPGWSCGSSQGSDGKQYWTCSGDGNIHECSGSTPIELACAAGCNHNPANSNDTCK
ncbi:MAG TPA: hypothetical protein VHB97_19695 [Polyangia bacterium]|jgi:hypothetical protein|nr:hypothetical protein [Polyangia bacterium]